AMVNLLETFTQPSLLDQLQVYHDASINFQDLKDFSTSVECGEKGLVAAQKRGDIVLAADILNTIAGSYELSGEMEQARKTYRQSISYLESINGDPSSIGIAYYNLAHSYAATADYEEALFHIKQSSNYPHNNDPSSPAYNENLHGEILAGLGRSEAALKQYATALRIAAGKDTLLQNGLLTIIPDSIELLKVSVDILANRAKLFIRENRLQAALADMNDIFALLDLHRERVKSDGSRYAISEGAWQYFDLAIGLQWRLYSETHNEDHLEQAFVLSERARAYSLLTALNEQRGSMSGQEQSLRQMIARLERASIGQPELLPELSNQKLKLELLLRTETPTSLSSPTAPPLDELRTLLAQQQLDLIEYHLGPAQSYRFHLSASGKLAVNELPGADSIRTLVTNWRRSITDGAYRQKSLRAIDEQEQLDQHYLEQGLTLQRLLLPSSEEIEGSRICFVPDGGLHFLPFAALPLKTAELPLDYRALTYLQDKYALQLAFSASYLLELESLQAPSFQENLLAFAPSFTGEASALEVSQLRGASLSNSVSINRTPVTTTLPALAPLRYNRSEVIAIADLVPQSQTFLDAQATRRAFLEAINNPPRILHLSSHGVANPDAPNLSFIAFAQAGEQLKEEELLYFNDLSTLPLRSELVVLSACETSLGALFPGESVMSLGSAFAAAGARSTLTSLWKVDDAATERLMVDFYAKLAAGEERTSALSNAQRLQRETGEFAHPYYWSAMTLTGRGGPIELSPGKGTFRPWYLLGGGFGLLLILWARNRSKKSEV
ncbi:MAG: CHAT domain-containing protein, partial [Bacteroidota bacterium]